MEPEGQKKGENRRDFGREKVQNKKVKKIYSIYIATGTTAQPPLYPFAHLGHKCGELDGGIYGAPHHITAEGSQ